MRERLRKETRRALRRSIEKGERLDPALADEIAGAMKDWAIEKGATHFTHWFQPMTGFTAEKHESFLSPQTDGKAMASFSGKELIKGEPDASSFPSGGLRATFEARGYTAWDVSSPVFLKEDDGGLTLCIPTAFCSYTGEALDKKTPLLRSMEALSAQAVRVLHALGQKDTERVIATVGAEQEYFLIDRKYFEQRSDLIFSGRTLFGAKPPKGQEMEDHYFGSIKERIAAFMRDLDLELWKLGVSAKTKHNEVAPAQHELAPVFHTTNIATDHNQLTMEVMKKVANRHGLVCLLHEKPFAGINGSGKHNNWSLQTDTGQNLLDPGSTPAENAQFLVFLAAVIKAVDEYADLMRLAASNPGNDHRLGANEAPPAIISIFLGEELQGVLEEIQTGQARQTNRPRFLDIGTSTLPHLPRDTSDRNRTSPFAFTGNKFEFRMVPSSISIAGANFTLNTIVAEALRGIADRLEGQSDLHGSINALVREIIQKHSRVVFNGNNYAPEWVDEAARRGLPNISNAVDAAQAMLATKNIELFERHKVFTKQELEARHDIYLENYIKTIRIEALTMIDMARRQITPAVLKYGREMAKSIQTIGEAVGSDKLGRIKKNLEVLTERLDRFVAETDALDKAVESADSQHEIKEHARAFRDQVFTAMQTLRQTGDQLELSVDAGSWPFPTYRELLFKV